MTTTHSMSFRLWALALLAVHVLFAARLALTVDSWQLDEASHASLSLWIAASGQLAPDLDAVPKLADDWSGWTSEIAGTNHPYPYFWAMAAVALPFDGYAAQLMAMRLANVLLSSLTLVAVIALARRLPLATPLRVLFVAQLALMPWVGFLGAHVTNDNLALFGGALLTLGAWRVFEDAEALGSWLPAAAGLLLAGISKGNALFLVGLFGLGLLAAALIQQPRCRRRAGPWLFAAAGLIAALPYVQLTLAYGSPIPETKSIKAAVDYWLQVTGWGAHRLTAWEYVSYFWQKLLGTGNPYVVERTNLLFPEEWHLRALFVVPLAGFGLAVAHTLRSLPALARDRSRDPLVWLPVIGGLVLALMIAAHCAFTYRFHLRTGWMNGVWLRYYMPLMAIPALAAAAMLNHLVPPRWQQPAALAGLAALGAMWAAR